MTERPADAAAVLQERARRLAARGRAGVAAPGSTLDLVVFRLAGERCAIESSSILHIFPLVDIARLPGALPPLFGVTVWRGDLLVVADLRAALGMSGAALNDLARVLVLDGSTRFGVLVDAVEDLVRVPAAGVRTPPAGIAARRDLVRGITDDAVIVLDGRAVTRLLDQEAP